MGLFDIFRKQPKEDGHVSAASGGGAGDDLERSIRKAMEEQRQTTATGAGSGVSGDSLSGSETVSASVGRPKAAFTLSHIPMR